MTIPSVVQGIIELEDGKVFELDSVRGRKWLESVGSFRYVPRGDGKAYTVRKEPSGYWYGCRKIAGTVRKKYIGKNSDVTTAKLEDITEALEDSLPPVSRVKKVAEVAEGVVEVAEVAQGRLATLESEVAMLRQAVEALQDALPGKSDAGNSEELPKVVEVAEGLQDELSNLKAENKNLLLSLERNDTIINLRNQEIATLNSRLATKDETIAETTDELDDREAELAKLRSELSDLKQNSTTASKDLPEAATILSQLRGKRKKSTVTLADIDAILGIIEES